MTNPEIPRRFSRLPRADAPSADTARAKFAESLDAIEAFLEHATTSGREAFVRNSPAYASGSMVIIRCAALFEVEEFAPFLNDVPHEVSNALRTMRNIASHGGYRAMNDTLFWATLTTDLPPYLTAWRSTLASNPAL
ncbi:hypothetical protein AB1K56_11140 [Microbacterium sp. BWR-S6Y]|uniref:hypothetical protein n=1 Tax=Microbacterium TaxID=33882 RepID=UPI00197C3C8F|nr:hypothetical protein [Microbacterium hydrothermale]